jgi:hypothetical protein
MCEPISIGLGVLGAATSLYGSYQSSQAQSKAASAISDQNFATQQAQNAAFNARMAASNRQTDAQTAAMQQTMADRNAAATQMRQAQQTAMKNQQDVLSQENQQATALRQTGDTAAQQLLQQTAAPVQDQAQQDYQNRAALLLGQATPKGPAPTGPGGGDAETQGAVARRLATAATNIRDYGSKVAQVGSYQAPLSGIDAAIQAARTGIMPAQTAETLLKSGNTTRLLPSQTAYQTAGQLGGSMDELIRSRGQGALDAAGLSYGNATSIANLQQQDSDVMAANKAAQAKADAAYQQQVGGMFSGLGQLGMYGAGYLGGAPNFLNSILPGGAGAATGAGAVGGKLPL